jgi:hypothetical protein
VFENGELRRIFGSEIERSNRKLGKTGYHQIHNLQAYTSSNIIKVI